MLFAVLDIFLFIYFLHFVTQYAKYQTIIHHIHAKTLQRLKDEAKDKRLPPFQIHRFEQTVPSPAAGYYEGCDERAMLSLPLEGGYQVQSLFPVGSFVLKGAALLRIHKKQPSR